MLAAPPAPARRCLPGPAPPLPLPTAPRLPPPSRTPCRHPRPASVRAAGWAPGRARLRSSPVSYALLPPSRQPGAGDKRPALAVFVSGGGSNLRAIHAAILRGAIHADVAVRWIPAEDSGLCK